MAQKKMNKIEVTHVFKMVTANSTGISIKGISDYNEDSVREIIVAAFEAVLNDDCLSCPLNALSGNTTHICRGLTGNH